MNVLRLTALVLAAALALPQSAWALREQQAESDAGLEEIRLALLDQRDPARAAAAAVASQISNALSIPTPRAIPAAGLEEKGIDVAPEVFASLFDHTNLNPDATRADIQKTAQEAKERGYALVAVRPEHASWAAEVLQGSSVKVGPAIGFRLLTSKYDGTAATREQALARYDIPLYEKQNEIRDTVGSLRDTHPGVGVEIDFVINVKAMVEGDETYVKNEIASLIGFVRRLQRPGERITVKVIGENAFLSEAQKRKIYGWARQYRADFVKTSTGFAHAGATEEDLRLMREVVGPEMGIKPAGGVRTLADAVRVIRAASPAAITPDKIRLGASASLAIDDAYRAARSAGGLEEGRPHSWKRLIVGTAMFFALSWLGMTLCDHLADQQRYVLKEGSKAKAIDDYSGKIQAQGGDRSSSLLMVIGGIPPLDPESFLDITPKQIKIVQSLSPLQFGPGILYHGRSGLDQAIKEDELKGEMFFTRVGYQWATAEFDGKSKDPAIFLMPTETFNRYLRQGDAVLRINGDRKEGIIDPYPEIRVAVPLSDFSEIWVAEDTFRRYEGSADRKIQALLAQGKIKAVPGLKAEIPSEGDVDKRWDSPFSWIGRYVLQRNLLKEIPAFEKLSGKPSRGGLEEIALPPEVSAASWVVLTPATAEALSGLAWLGQGGAPLRVAVIVENDAQEARVRAELEEIGEALDLRGLINLSRANQTLGEAIVSVQVEAWAEAVEVLVVDTFQQLRELGRFLKIPDGSFRSWLEWVRRGLEQAA